MASRNTPKRRQIQIFVRDQLEEAQKRLTSLESDAEKMFKHVIARGREQRRELEGLVNRLNANGEALLENVTVQKLSKRANIAGTQVRKHLDQLQSRVVKAVGVASQAQVREITRELAKLSKKVDALVSKRPARAQLTA